MNRVLIPPVIKLTRHKPGTGVHGLGGETMGTTWSVAIAAADPDLTDIRRRIEAELALVNDQMSLWSPSSTLCRFNALRPGEVIDLPPAFREVLECALRIASDTGGAFDPTLFDAADAWGFGPSSTVRLGATPVSGGGWRDLSIVGRRLVQPGGVRLDLGGIAKGYAVDRVADVLNLCGLRAHLIEIGGELRGTGARPDGQPWWVEIEQPPGNAPCLPTLVALNNFAIASTGTYRRYFERDGLRYSHSIDPKTGVPSRTDLSAVSVLHSSGMEADALATALTVMGLTNAIAFATTRKIAALFILSDGPQLASPELLGWES